MRRFFWSLPREVIFPVSEVENGRHFHFYGLVGTRYHLTEEVVVKLKIRGFKAIPFWSMIYLYTSYGYLYSRRG